MKKISVIIPVYNVEKYIEECIDSTINQTYPNLEILLIDDGSTDNSGDICDMYAEKDSRIKVIHQINGGLGNARNTGLNNATGDYIMFADSDDFFTPNACEIMLNEIESKNADYVIGNYQYCTEESEPWEKPIFDTDKYKNFKLNIKDYKHSFYIMNSSVCNKIFRTSFINEIGVRFEEGIPAEDAIFSTYCFMKTKKVYYISDVMYLYRQRREASSISTNCSYTYFEGISKAYKLIYENFKENNELGFYRYFYAKSMTYILYKFIDSTLLTEEEKINIVAEMRWFYKLSKELNVPACQESLDLIITKIIDGEYKDVIDICKVISEIRTFMPREIKQKMSKPQSELYDKLEETMVEVYA